MEIQHLAVDFLADRQGPVVLKLTRCVEYLNATIQLRYTVICCGEVGAAKWGVHPAAGRRRHIPGSSPGTVQGVFVPCDGARKKALCSNRSRPLTERAGLFIQKEGLAAVADWDS